MNVYKLRRYDGVWLGRACKVECPGYVCMCVQGEEIRTENGINIFDDRKVANLFLQTQVNPLQLLAELDAQSSLLPSDQWLPTN